MELLVEKPCHGSLLAWEDDSLDVALRILKIPYAWELEIWGAVVAGGKSD